MKHPENIYNVYCDESRVENPDSQNMVIGALFIPRSEKKRIAGALNAICSEHKYFGELKWVKTGSKFTSFYKALIDYFFTEEAVQYRCIVVDKSKVCYEDFHDNDPELAFFKFYYLMLRSRLKDHAHYYIFLDKKPTRDRNRARALRSYLEMYVSRNKQKCVIEHFQAYSSHENILIQMADYFTGLIGHAVNRPADKTSKYEIINHLKSKMGGRDIAQSTTYGKNKFNIFVWKDMNEKDS